jgi:SM-20-related protein
VLADLGPFATPLRDRLSALQDELVAELKVTPFRTARIELQIAAHGDGAFFRRHRDLARPGDRPRKTRRVMSGVYYLHAVPKAFGGGAFRLHEVLPRGDVAQHLDIEPQHNAAIFFPAWMPHEVTPVSCPSRRFADFRFAINCWYHEAI